MKLYLKQKVFKFLDHYDVYDENQNAIFTVNQKFKFLGFHADVTAREDYQSFEIDKEIITFLPKYVLTFENAEKIYLNFRLSFIHRKIDVKTTFENLSVRGKFWDMDFEVLKEGEVIADISKKWLTWGDTYEVDIYDDKYTSEILGIVIAIDNQKDMERNQG